MGPAEETTDLRALWPPFAPGYVPRPVEASVLHVAVRENMETFLARARERTEHGFGV